MTYENPWHFNGEVFDSDQIDKSEGFVYLITNTITNRKYIGRKYFYEIRKVKGKTRRVRRESNWKSYYGSSPSLSEDIEKYGKNSFKREILSLHKTRGDVNYEEVKQQFLNNVLESDEWYNDNINGKWRSKPQHIIEGRRYAD
jgi:hypothetical protein